jgi:hypothetical protein
LTENRTETAKTFLAKELEKLSEQERHIVERFIHRGRIARNVARVRGWTDLRAAARKHEIEMLGRLVAEDCALLPAIRQVLQAERR